MIYQYKLATISIESISLTGKHKGKEEWEKYSHLDERSGELILFSYIYTIKTHAHLRVTKMHVEIDEWKSMQVTKIKAGINMKYISYHRDIKIYIDLTISVFFSFRNYVQGDGIGCGQLISFVPESKNSSWLAPREKYSLLLKSCTLWQFTTKQIIKGQSIYISYLLLVTNNMHDLKDFSLKPRSLILLRHLRTTSLYKFKFQVPL